MCKGQLVVGFLIVLTIVDFRAFTHPTNLAVDQNERQACSIIPKM